MKIIIARHGEAEYSSSSGSDRDRELTEKGKSDVLKVAQFVKNSPIHITRIYHSPFKRTTQTADIFFNTIEKPEVPIESSNLLLPSSDYMDLLPDLCNYSNSETILIVGHNPDVCFLTARLLKSLSLHSALVFQPGTIIAVNVAREKFCDGQLIWVVSPDLLP